MTNNPINFEAWFNRIYRAAPLKGAQPVLQTLEQRLEGAYFAGAEAHRSHVNNVILGPLNRVVEAAKELAKFQAYLDEYPEPQNGSKIEQKYQYNLNSAISELKQVVGADKPIQIDSHLLVVLEQLFSTDSDLFHRLALANEAVQLGQEVVITVDDAWKIVTEAVKLKLAGLYE